MKEYKSNLPEITLKYKTGLQKNVKIASSKDSYELFLGFYDEDTIELTESFICIFLNKGNRSLGWIKISSGGISGTVADPKIIMATALGCGASSIILSHNHPSGNRLPSEQDIRLTKSLKEGAIFLDMIILDHIIIGAGDTNYYSFADEGTL